ncbi:MAG: hypothetical protein ACTSYZ_01095 [Candidatus Helarchaeota archaeon]
MKKKDRLNLFIILLLSLMLLVSSSAIIIGHTSSTTKTKILYIYNDDLTTANDYKKFT